MVVRREHRKYPLLLTLGPRKSPVRNVVAIALCEGAACLFRCIISRTKTPCLESTVRLPALGEPRTGEVCQRWPHRQTDKRFPHLNRQTGSANLFGRRLLGRQEWRFVC